MCIYKIKKIPLSLVYHLGWCICVSIITVHVALFLSFGITPISLQTQSRLIINDPGNKGNNCFCHVAITFLT